MAKLEIAQKETAETLYWLELLESGGYISKQLYDSFCGDCKQIMAILKATIRTCKEQ